MKHGKALPIAAAMSLLATISSAEAAAPAAASDGKAVLASFVAPWNCKGTIYAWETGESQPSHLLWTFERSLGGWLHMTGQQLSTEHAPGPDWMSGLQYLGYDNVTEEYLFFGLDDHGGTWSQTGQLQADGRIIFHGPYRSTVDGKLVASRDTWQVADGKLHHVGEIERQGKYRKTDEETCTRQ